MRDDTMETFTHFIFATDAGINRESFADQLSRFPHKNLRGGYVMDDGTLVDEPSYLVSAAAWTALREFFGGQESILWLTEAYHKPNLRKAYLEYLDEVELGKPSWLHRRHMNAIDLGWFQEAPKSMTHDRLAREFGGYTVDLDTNKTFVAAPKRF
jgi:hypothetical protein